MRTLQKRPQTHAASFPPSLFSFPLFPTPAHIERQGKNEKVRFRRGDKIWILPDPEELPPSSHDVEIDDLDDDYWWVGEILDCCALDQSSQGADNLGLLRIQVSRQGISCHVGLPSSPPTPMGFSLPSFPPSTLWPRPPCSSSVVLHR